ncbi:hypothetical protein ACRS5S_22700 [Nocardia asiatica]|uniref:hypothetical protein n=1 Tax=Nocardia asiatica TaxID=209252 RepID=UPI003EDEC94C
MSANSERSSGPDTGVSTRARSGELSRAESDAVAAFSAAWESTRRPPTIAEFLPDATTLRREALLELIRVDLRHRWLHRPGATPERAARMRLADYCAEFPELASEDIPAGLVYEEFVIRRQSGERVDPRECLREYPRQAKQLRELLNAERARSEHPPRDPGGLHADRLRAARFRSRRHRVEPNHRVRS